MSYKYVIDSSAWVEYLTGSAKGISIKQLIEQEEIASSIIAIAELADKFEREKRNFIITLQFIKSRATILPVSVPIALNAAKLKNEIRVKKEKFGLSDAIHLATAADEEAVLVTADNDFSGLGNVMNI